MAKPSTRAATPAGGSLFDNLLKRQRAATPVATPFVSVVCPTWNRREFLPYLLYIYQYQDYPADKRELIILDDSEHSNEDLIAMMVDGSQQNVRYIHSKERLALGKKRNMLNEMARGEYIICFDDDDYYPPNKISYQICEMQSHKALFSGSDQIYVWYSHLDKIYLTNSFGANHALNGTFGLHKNLLKKNRYQDEAMLAEEQAFLRGFTTPVLQIDPKQAILCISHSTNTYDKDFILGSSTPVELRLEDLVADPNLLAHYRRLSRAPLSTSVNWSVFDKVAVIYDPAREELLMEQCRGLTAFGLPAEKLMLVALHSHEDADVAELQTHCTVLEQAQAQALNNVLLLDASVRFVKKEAAVNHVNALLNQLENIDWHVLLLGAKHLRIQPMSSLKGVARVHEAQCASAYAVNGAYIPQLLEHYRQALQEKRSCAQAWLPLAPEHCWLGFYPSFAFIQQAKNEAGQQIDCTHWFFLKHSS